MKRKLVSLAVCISFVAMLALVPAVSAAKPVTGTGTPSITSISPSVLGNGIGNKKASVKITGTGFDTGARVKFTMVGQLDIKGKVLKVPTPPTDTEINCRVNLKNAAAGDWDVVVTNPNKNIGTLPGGLKVTEHPVIESIATDVPVIYLGNANVGLTIDGANFQDGVTVKLSKGAIGTIDVVVDSVSSTEIQCHFNMSDPPAHLGAWKILLANPDNGIHQAPTFKVVVKPAPAV